MMRIGYLTYGLDRAPTGIGRYAVELLHALRALPERLDIVLLTTEREDQHGLWNAFERYALPGCRMLPALMAIGHGAVSHAIGRHQLDLVHDPNGIAPFWGSSHGARRVVTIHDAFAYVYPEAHNRLDTWRYHWMLPTGARRADAVLTDSDHSRGDLLHYLGLRPDFVQVTGCGIDPRFAPVDDQAMQQAVIDRYKLPTPYLLYVGSINARKNIARLLEAYARVRERHPQLNLVIGGKRQWQTRAIDETLERLRLTDHIHFTGYVSDTDLPALYSAATAFVFPSLYEGFGLPPLEAMACGTPVITSNVSSLPEVVGNAALLVDPYDVQALTRAIERIVQDEALRADLRQRGLGRAQQFSWAEVARKTCAVYEQVLNQPGNSSSLVISEKRLG